jgi:drug/metabolite transporter (DMT)-like permease
VAKRYFSDLPVGLVVTFRVVIGASLFMLIQVARRTDLGVFAYSLGQFWTNIVWYGVVYVALGEMTFLTAVVKADPIAISVGTTSLFVLTVLWSMAIQRQLPTGPEWIGSAFITASVVSSIIREIRLNKPDGALLKKQSLNEEAEAAPQEPVGVAERSLMEQQDSSASGSGRL